MKKIFDRFNVRMQAEAKAKIQVGKTSPQFFYLSILRRLMFKSEINPINPV